MPSARTAEPVPVRLDGGTFDQHEVLVDPKDRTVLVGAVAGRTQVLLGPDLDRAPEREVYQARDDGAGVVWRHVELNRPEWWGSDEVSP